MPRSRGLSSAGASAHGLATAREFVTPRDRRLLVFAVVHQPVLPFVRAVVVADRRVQRRAVAEAAVHVDHVLLRDPEVPGDGRDMVGMHFAFLEGGDPALGRAEIEEQLPSFAVLPILTTDHERRIYSWMADLNHHMA